MLGLCRPARGCFCRSLWCCDVWLCDLALDMMNADWTSYMWLMAWHVSRCFFFWRFAVRDALFPTSYKRQTCMLMPTCYGYTLFVKRYFRPVIRGKHAPMPTSAEKRVGSWLVAHGRVFGEKTHDMERNNTTESFWPSRPSAVPHLLLSAISVSNPNHVLCFFFNVTWKLKWLLRVCQP